MDFKAYYTPADPDELVASGDITLTFIILSVDITGFTDDEPYARHPSCPVANHQTMCQATIEPTGISTITYSIQGDAHGATIDANTGIITPGSDESGEIIVRAAATVMVSCFDEETLTIKARPNEITESTAEKHEFEPVHVLYTHTFGSTGGDLTDNPIVELVTVSTWPFRQPDEWVFDGIWVLDADGTMTEPDHYKVASPGEIFVPEDFDSFPQMGYLHQRYKWYCPKCMASTDREVATGVIFYWLLERSGGIYAVQIDTSYQAGGEPFEWIMP